LLVNLRVFIEMRTRNDSEAQRASLFAEIDAMVRVIPEEELSIQWDIAAEVTVLETPQLLQFYPREELIGALSRAVDHVPAGSEVGLHLCYGDPGGKHVIDPKDLSLLVELANAVMAQARHPIAWLHMPVPASRTDAAYFAALQKLKHSSDTDLYLGLVHLADGLEGAEDRIAAAQPFARHFGIATECGLGRRPKDTIPDSISLHARIAQSDKLAGM
jgi:methionine synthase II (cobalamin-independent)